MRISISTLIYVYHMFCNIPASLHVNKDIPSLTTLSSGNNQTGFT